MLKQISGLHHVTSLASDANENNRFFTSVLGLRRIKKTVNFDAPDVYHLYYGNQTGAPGTVMTCFPFPNISRGTNGTGEVGATAFSIPRGTLPYWQKRLEKCKVEILQSGETFGEKRLEFTGPDNEHFALVETMNDQRVPWSNDEIPTDTAIRGFHSVSMRLADDGAMLELLKFMNHEIVDHSENLTRLKNSNGNGAEIIDIEIAPGSDQAQQGAGSVHHVAFAVKNRAAQNEVRQALLDTGYAVTPVIDRNYFWAIYFRTPGGVLFEVSTNEPGFSADEPVDHLGTDLKLPEQHEHLRSQLEKTLPPIS